jgi:hypothetical protein
MPRLVRHRECEWAMIVADTAYVLEFFGVGHGKRVLVGQPSYPWSIGAIFAEAATMCGAECICLGLEGGHGTLREAALALRPQVLFLPPRLLLRWDMAARQAVAGATLIAAGEPVTEALEHEVRLHAGLASVVRIYGHSELGTIGFQAGTEIDLYSANPRFDYSVITRNSDGEAGPALGELMVRSRYSDEKIETGDLADIQPDTRSAGLWSGGPSIRLLGRRQACLHLADGTRIDTAALLYIQEELGAAGIQLIRESRGTVEEVTFQVASGLVKLDDSRVEQVIRGQWVDLADAEQRGVCRIRGLVVALSDMQTTDRGKVPLLVDLASTGLKTGGAREPFN